jgi:hypothetical protein
MRKYGSINLIVTISMVIAIVLFLPGLGLAGSLEPSGPPAPTMRTLDEIYSTNSWSKKLPCESQANCPRFEVLADFNSEAVLDKETGLVWEKSPSTSTYNWQSAGIHCQNLLTGGRGGWRLPTLQELESLKDPAGLSTGVYLPSGFPFSNVQVGNDTFYWTANYSLFSLIYAQTPGSAYLLSFGSGGFGPVSGGLGNSEYVWCVRGGSGNDLQ